MENIKDIVELCKKYPNDQELGKMVRVYINNMVNKNKNG